MNKKLKRILIVISSILGLGVLAYLGFVIMMYYTFTVGCGMDDGPFEAEIIKEYKSTENQNVFKLKEGELIIDNRNDTLSPIILLKEKGKAKWILDTDTRNTKGYEYTRIWEISNVTIEKETSEIHLSFVGHWTFGAERGKITIDRKDGENKFCLSW